MPEAESVVAQSGRWPVWALPAAMLALIGGGAALGWGFFHAPGGGALGLAAAMVMLAYAKHRESKLNRGADSGAHSAAGARFVSMLGVWMALYAISIVLISWVFDIETWPLWARAIAAIMPALPIGGVIHALMTYVKTEPDEYQRMLLTRIVLLATGLTFFTLTAWGFLELYVGAPGYPASLVMCPFWLFFGFAQWWVRRRA